MVGGGMGDVDDDDDVVVVFFHCLQFFGGNAGGISCNSSLANVVAILGKNQNKNN